MNPNTPRGLSSLHNRFQPEYTEEDEILSDLKGAAQQPIAEARAEDVPSVYDNPRSFTQQTNDHLMDTVGKGLGALKDYLVESFTPKNEFPGSENAGIPAGKDRVMAEPVASPIAEQAPSALSKVKNFFSEGYTPSFNYPDKKVRDEVNAAKMAKTESVPEKMAAAAMSPDQVKFFDNSPAARQSMSPEAKEQYAQAKNKDIQSFDEKIAQIQKNKESDLIPGAADEMLKDPMAMAKFGQITGIDYTPQLKESLKPYEALAKQAQDTLSQEEAEIRQRFENGTMTKNDKIMLGLAVAVPAILAGIFGGGEAAAGALAGGLKGVSEGMKSQQERALEDRKRLAEIGKEKLVIEGSNADLKKKLKDLVPEDVKTQALEGKSTVYIPETGKTGVKVGNDALYYDMDNLSKGDIKNELTDMRALAKDARERMEAVDSLYDVTNDLDKVYDQLIKQGNKSFFPSVAGKTVPGGENWFSADVVDPKTGKKMKASVLIGQLVEKGLDKYRTSQVGGSRAITDAMRTHFDQLLGNPFKLDQALSIQDAKNMAEAFQTIAAKEFIQGMETEGFLRQPLEKRFLLPIEQKNRATAQQTEKQRRANQAAEEIKKMTPDQVRQLRQGQVVETSNG